MSKMEFKVGDFVRHHATKAQGHIVRIVEYSHIDPKAKGLAYVVSLPPHVMIVGNNFKVTIRPAREVLWRRCEVVQGEAQDASLDRTESTS